MVAGELTFHLFLQPLPGLMVLTSRAMAIATGAIDPVELATFFALINGDPRSFSTTGDDGIDDFTVDMRHGLGIAFQVLRAEGSEDLIDGGHGRVPP